MQAPPGVDSDSSGEEEETENKVETPRSPTPKETFFKSLLSTTLPVKPASKETKAKAEQAEETAGAEAPAPLPKRRVRIHVEGEEHPDKIDLVATPVVSTPSEDDPETMGRTGVVVPSDNTAIATEVVGLLREILAQSKVAQGQGTSSQTASIVPIEEDFEDEEPVRIQDNSLGLTGMEKKKRPSKLSMFTKLAQFHSPSRPPVHDEPVTQQYQPMSAPWGQQSQIQQAQAQAQAQQPTSAPAKSHGYTYQPIPEPHPYNGGPPLHWHGPESQPQPRSQNWQANQPPRLKHGTAQEYYQGYTSPQGEQTQEAFGPSAQQPATQPQSAPPWTTPYSMPMPQAAQTPNIPPTQQLSMPLPQHQQQQQPQPQFDPPSTAPGYPGYQPPCQHCGYHGPGQHVYQPWYPASFWPPVAPLPHGAWYPPYHAVPYSPYTPPTYTSSPQNPVQEAPRAEGHTESLRTVQSSPSAPLVPAPRDVQQMDSSPVNYGETARSARLPTESKDKASSIPNVDTAVQFANPNAKDAIKSPTIVVQSPQGFKQVEPYPETSKAVKFSDKPKTERADPRAAIKPDRGEDEKEAKIKEAPIKEEAEVKKQVNLILKQRERIMLKVSRGDMSEEDAKVALKKLDKAMEGLKDPGQSAPKSYADGKIESTGVEETSAKAAVKKQTKDIRPPDPQFVQARLEEVRKKMQKMQKAFKDGSIDKDSAKDEYTRLSKEEKALKTQRDSLARATEAREEVAGDKSAHSHTPLVNVDQDLAGRKADIELRIDGVKGKVANGTMDQEQARKHLDKLVRMRNDLDGKMKEPPEAQPKSNTMPLPETKPRSESSSDNPSNEPPPGSSGAEMDLRLNEEMAKIKLYLSKGKMSREDGKKALEKLRKARALTVQDSAVTKPDSDQRLDLSATVEDAVDKQTQAKASGRVASGFADASDARSLDDVKKQMSKIKLAVTKGKLDREEGEKMLRRLAKEGQSLSTQNGTSTQSSFPTPGRELDAAGTAATAHNAGSLEMELDQELDPEILHEILQEDITRRPTIKETNQKLVANPATLPALGLPGTFPSSIRQTSRPESTKATVLSASGQSVDRPATDVEIGHPPRWSEALVSLTTCIDIANSLLTNLLDTHKSVDPKFRGVDSSATSLGPLLVQVVPRVLTALAMQKDAEGVVLAVFGDADRQTSERFLRHLNHLQSYLIHLEQRSADRKQNAKPAGDIFGTVDRLLQLGQSISLENLKSLRILLRSWKKDGLTVPNLIRTVQFVRHDLSPDKTSRPGSRTESFLDKLVNLPEVEEVEEGSAPHARRPKRISLRSDVSSTSSDSVVSQTESPPSPSARERLASMLSAWRYPTSNSATAPKAERGSRGSSNSKRQGKARAENTEVVDRRQTQSVDRPAREVEGGHTPTSPGEAAMGQERDLRHQHPRQSMPKPELHLPPAAESFMQASHEKKVLEQPRIPSPRKTGKEGMSPDHASAASSSPATSPQGTSPVDSSPARPSLSSSDSLYSVSSEGTIASDIEASTLLASADSGPPLPEPNDDSMPSTPGPSSDQVKRAREVLLMDK